MRIAICTVLFFSWVTQPVFGGSNWTTAGPKRSGNYLSLSCDGTGPDRSIAQRDAIDQCISMASNQLIGDFHVQSVSIETQRSAGFHEEVSTDRAVEGLNCNIKRQEIEEDHGSYHMSILCEFDIQKVKLIYSKGPKDKGRFISSENRMVTFVSVPPCDDILVKGDQSRIIECKNNPMQIFQRKGDQEYIIRARGYLPKHLDSINQSILEVYLERE